MRKERSGRSGSRLLAPPRDIVIYVRRGDALNDTDNERFLAFEAPKSDDHRAITSHSFALSRPTALFRQTLEQK